MENNENREIREEKTPKSNHVLEVMEKQTKLDEIRKTIDETGDALGKEVDPGIKETVVFLNALEIPTCGSCEGHKEWGTPWPHVEVEAPGEPEERWENQTSIFQETAIKYGISLEDVKRANNFDAWQEARYTSSKNPETADFKVWREENKKLFERVSGLLADFYQERQDISPDNKLTLSELDGGEFSITFPDANLSQEMFQQKTVELKKKLPERRAEMDAFTKFLEKKYWEN